MYNLSPPETASCNYKGQCRDILGGELQVASPMAVLTITFLQKSTLLLSGFWLLSTVSAEQTKKKKKKLESTNYPPLTHGCAINQTQSERDPARERETRREDSCRLPRSLPVCPWGTGKLSRGRAKKQCSALSTLSYLKTPLCAGDWQRLCFPQPFRCGTSNMAHNMKGHIEQQSGVLRLLNPSPEDQCEMEPLHTTLIDDGPIK